MRIRKAEAGDISAWMQVLHLVEQYFPGLCPEEYEKGLEESIGREEALVAEEKGILGMAAFSLSRGEIEFLAVHPAARRRGVAGELLKHILAGFPEGRKITVEIPWERRHGRYTRQWAFLPGRSPKILAIPASGGNMKRNSHCRGNKGRPLQTAR